MKTRKKRHGPDLFEMRPRFEGELEIADRVRRDFEDSLRMTLRRLQGNRAGMEMFRAYW